MRSDRWFLPRSGLRAAITHIAPGSRPPLESLYWLERSSQQSSGRLPGVRRESEKHPGHSSKGYKRALVKQLLKVCCKPDLRFEGAWPNSWLYPKRDGQRR